MKFVRIMLMAAVLGLSSASPEPAEAKTYFSFGYYGPGISIYTGHYPRYYGYYGYRRHRYYSPYDYRPYYGGYRPSYYDSYRPTYDSYSYTRPKRYRKYGGNCSRWSKRCGANWGYGNSDYIGCMKYHSCR